MEKGSLRICSFAEYLSIYSQKYSRLGRGKEDTKCLVGWFTAQDSSAAAGREIGGRRGGVVAREAIPLLKQFPYTRQLSQLR